MGYDLLYPFFKTILGGDKDAEGILKAAITDTATMWEEKGVTAKEGHNFWNVIVTSNQEFCVPATIDSRRFFVLEMDKKAPKEFFAALHNDIDNGTEVQEFLHYLLHRKLPTNWRAAENIPRSMALANMMLRSRQGIAPFVKWMVDKCFERQWVYKYNQPDQWKPGCFVTREEVIIYQDGENKNVPKNLVVAALRAEIRTNEALKKKLEKEYTSASEVTKMFNELLGPDLFRTVESKKKQADRYTYHFGSMEKIEQHLEENVLKYPGYFAELKKHVVESTEPVDNPPTQEDICRDDEQVLDPDQD